MPRIGGRRPCAEAARILSRPWLDAAVPASFQRFRGAMPPFATMWMVSWPDSPTNGVLVAGFWRISNA